MENYIKALKAIADPVRIKILKLLLKSNVELCVCEIVDSLNLPFYTISRHIKELKNAHLLKESKDGKFVHYSLNRENNDFVKNVFKLINSIPETEFKKEILSLEERLSLREKGRCVIGIVKKSQND
mgnify:CR=1 FL=1